MKLLIIAGPYEADRIRRAVVSAGFEAVAVEPGESLSGWITASRPDLIVLAPQIVNADPEVALAKVRAVPRGRVPTFLVGEPEDEARMKDLADGFLVRPLSTTELVERVRARLGAAPSGTGGLVSAGSPSERPAGASVARSLPTLRPLVAAADADVGIPVSRARTSQAGALFVKLAESIDATLDAEMLSVARSVGAPRREAPPSARRAPESAVASAAPSQPAPSPKAGRRPSEDPFERTPMAPMTALAAAAALPLPSASETRAPASAAVEASSAAAFEAVEAEHASRQKTVEVPRDVFAKMIADRIAATHDGGTAAGAPAPVESGKLADNDVAAQLGRMSFQRLTGRLVLRRGPVEKIIFFDRGAPVLGTSNLPEDRMGEMLVRQGRLTAKQLARAAAELPGAERRLGLVLVESGFITASELPVIVRRHFEEIIHSTFGWEDGEWALGPGQPSHEIVLLDEHPGAIIIAGIRRKYSAARLARCLGGGGHTFRLASGAATAEVVRGMALTPEERAVVGLFDGTRTLEEVRAYLGAREEVVAGVAWALSVLGQLERVEPRVADAANGPGARAVNGAGAPTAAAGLERPSAEPSERERVRARYALVEEGDYFQVLDLPRGASLEDVRRAHDALMSALAPTSLAPSLVAELGAELRAIRRVLDEALRVLGEPTMRLRYESHLPPEEHAAP